MLIGYVVVGIGMCWLLKRVLEKQYATFREDHRDTRVFTAAAIEALRDIKNSCDRCHLATIATVKVEMGSVADKIVTSMRTEHELTRSGTREIVEAIGREEDRTIEALTGVRQVVDLSYDLLKQHKAPPVGGTGSAVRDSVAK
jgi:hypothetical protein